MAAKKTMPKANKCTKSAGSEKKFTTSKKIVFSSYILGILLSALTVWGVYKGYDVTALGVITAAAYAEIAASNAFYFWKAKKENTMKIALATVKETPTEKVEDIVKLVNAMGGIV